MIAKFSKTLGEKDASVNNFAQIIHNLEDQIGSN